jgi:hypothetical protein
LAVNTRWKKGWLYGTSKTNTEEEKELSGGKEKRDKAQQVFFNPCSEFEKFNSQPEGQCRRVNVSSLCNRNALTK